MEIVTDYEVYGCWTTETPVSKCPKCSLPLQLVPETGHYNSKYWKLKQNDGLALYCCPSGCALDFKGEIVKNFKPISKDILRYFYMIHNVDIDEDERFDINFILNNHTTSSQEHERKVHYIYLKDFVYNYNGFVAFHDEYYGSRATTEFMIDVKSGIVFFNIYSHEPFASNLYRPLYRELRDDDRLGKATDDGLCVWKSTVSDEIFGLEESEDNFIKARFR